MSILKFCHLKKDDRVIILSGDYKKYVGIVTGVIRDKKKFDRFFVSIDSVPKRKVKKNKTKGSEIVERDFLIDSSNVSVIKNEDSIVG